MPKRDALLQTIEAVHAAGLDPELWPQALARTAGLFDSSAVTLERFEVPTGSLSEYHAFGVPPAQEIALDHFATHNPRAAHAIRHPENRLCWDYQFIDEPAMARDSYYADFLRRVGLRYFISGQFLRTPAEMAVVAVQRTPAQGHVGRASITLMELLLPHFRQAFDVATRLRRAAGAGRSLEGALDWLADGVALVARDGAVLYANEALQEIVRGKGIAIKKGALDFDSAEARARFAQALGAVSRLRHGDSKSVASHDFPVARPTNASPYLVSLRPVARAASDTATRGRAIAIVFVRDTLRQDTAGVPLLVEVFGLTPAEAGLARAIQAGIPLDKYARGRAVSLNTIYTHLRRLKEKTGCKRMSELIRKFNELKVPLRLS
ncbi:MAG: helix-turn-helix transcriptional regulator [Xanthobacteraceae bacterium]